MKIKAEYVLRQITDEYLAIPVGEEKEKLHGVIRLNEVGAFLWDCLSVERSEEDLLHCVMENYKIDEEKAKQDIRGFIAQLETMGCLDE